MEIKDIRTKMSRVVDDVEVGEFFIVEREGGQDYYIKIDDSYAFNLSSHDMPLFSGVEYCAIPKTVITFSDNCED